MRSNATTPTSEPADSTVFQALVLSVIAGCADAVAFLKYGVFAGVMTGNTVLLGVALADDDVAHALRLALIIGGYLAGIALATVLRRLGHSMRVLLLVEGVFVVIAAAFDAGWASVPLLAVGMGIQSAATSRFIGSALSTVYLTGDLLKLVQGLVARLPFPPGAARGHGSTEAVVGVIWVGYLFGVLLGVAAHAVVGRPLLVIPLLLPLALIRGDRRPAGIPRRLRS